MTAWWIAVPVGLLLLLLGFIFWQSNIELGIWKTWRDRREAP